MLNILHRTIIILDILTTRKTVKPAELMEALNVSHVTLRKDLDKLERRGIIKCTHGYVNLDDTNNTCKKIASNYSIKKKIVKAAALTVEDGETIMIGSGSCCALFAEELAHIKKNIAIITNSTFTANFVCHVPNIRIILLGGYYQPESQVLLGQMTVKYAEGFSTDKYFLGTDGFIPGKGFTGGDYLRVETAVGLTRCARRVIILTDAAKFYRQGAYNLINLDKLSGVFTDDSIPKDAEEDLLKNNVTLHKVSLVEEKIKWRKFPELPPILYKTKE